MASDDRAIAGSALGRAVAVGVGVLTVACAGVAAASGNPVATEPYIAGDRLDLGPRDSDRPPPRAGTLPEPDEAPTWLQWLLEGFVWLCVAAIVVMLVVLALRHLRGPGSSLVRRRVLEPEEVAALTAPSTDVDLIGRGRPLDDAVEAGMAALAEGNDVRAGVITAWLRLEEAAAEAGTPRREDDAPGDLVTRVLADHQVRPRRLQSLAELYRRARFSPAPMDEDDRQEASRALRDVRDDLLGEPTAGAQPAWTGQPGVDGRWPTRWT